MTFSSSVAADESDQHLASSFDGRQHGEEVVGRAQVAVAGADEEVALADVGRGGR